MESTMDTIETRLQQGATPKQLILDGFKKSTVYKVDKRLKTKGGLGKVDRALYLAYLISMTYQELFAEIHEALGDDNYDPSKGWRDIIKNANECFTYDTKRKPPQDLML